MKIRRACDSVSASKKHNARAKRGRCREEPRWLAVQGVGRDPLDIRARDTDIGQFAVAEMRQLAPDFAIPLPSMDKAGNGCKHFFLVLSPEVLRRKTGNRVLNIGMIVHRTIEFAAVQLDRKRMPGV